MRKARNLSSLSKSELVDFLNSFDTVLCDNDGVLMFESGPITGSKETVEFLQKNGKKVFVVSNNCLRTLEEVNKKFRKHGYTFEDGDIINPISVTIDYLKKINFQKKIFLFTISGLKKELENAGFHIVDPHDVKIEGKDSLSLIALTQQLDPDVGAVFLDADIMINYVALQQAIEYLKKPDVLLFGTGTDKIIPYSEKLKLMGPGHFFEIIKYMTGKEPLIMGKPGKTLNDFILNKISNPSKTLFIGDAMEQDILFARVNGYKSLLVLSGASTKEQVENCQNENYIPDFYTENLNSLRIYLGKL